MVCKLFREIVAKGFPAGSQIVDDIDDVVPEERFWIIPGKNGPRWLIPQDIRYSRLIFRYWNPYDLISRAKWKILHGANCMGRLGSVPGIASVGIAGSARQQWDHLGWKEDDNPVPIIYIGTPGPTQKAVLSLFDSRNNNLISVAKIPLGDRASDNILREYEVLRYLEVERPSVAPRPLFVNREYGLAVQEAIEGKRLGRKFTYKHAAYLNRLRVSKDVTTIRAEGESLARRFKNLKNTDKRLGRYVENLVDGLKDVTEMPVVQAHGDFKPWNVLCNRAGGIVAIDWEFSESRQILGLDVIHYHHHKNVSKRKRDYRQLFNVLQQFLLESGVVKAKLPLIESLLNYHSLWYVVMLCENGYNVSDHVQL